MAKTVKRWLTLLYFKQIAKVVCGLNRMKRGGHHQRGGGRLGSEASRTYFTDPHHQHSSPDDEDDHEMAVRAATNC